MEFILRVRMDNAAFEENPGELARILRELPGEDLQAHGEAQETTGAKVRDSNGNTVGFWEVK